MKYSQVTLPNKLRAIFVPLQDTQTVTVMVAAATGSRYENRENNGISHFLEHMFFKGTTKRPTTLIISEELDSIGADYNAFTSKDWTAYYVKADAKHLDNALDVVSDMLKNSLFEEEEIEREKGTIIQEFNMYEDMPIRLISDNFEQLLYGDQPLGWKILGTKENVQKFNREDFLKYMQSQYVAKNMAIVVAGKFDEEKIEEQVASYFQDMPIGEARGKEKVTEDQKEPQISISKKETDQTHFILGIRSYDMFHPDRYVLSIISNILGGNMSSRLFTEVREKRGLAYNVSTFVEEYHDTGYLATQCGVEHDNLLKTVEIIVSEYKKIATEKVDERELKKAKEYLKAKLVMGLETSDELAGFFLNQEVLKNQITLPEEITWNLDAITADDVLRVAKDIFQGQKLNLAVIGPEQDQAKLKNILKL